MPLFVKLVTSLVGFGAGAWWGSVVFRNEGSGFTEACTILSGAAGAFAGAWFGKWLSKP